MPAKMHFSIDDTKGIFKALAQNTAMSSIFDTRALGFLRKLHNSYGTEFTLLCMYQSKEFKLPEVPEIWKKEFLMNKDWLHFGFHSIDENSDYSEASAEEIRRDYNKLIKELSRITGEFRFDSMIRLHGFSGSINACRELKRIGINCLFTADDDRCSYFLNDDECSIVNDEGIYNDRLTNLKFCRSLTRLELSDHPVQELERAKDSQWELLSVFTHEWQLDRDVIRQKLEECCAWEKYYRKEMI